MSLLKLGLLGDSAGFIVLGSMFISARTILYERYRSGKSIAVSLLVALPSGVIVGGAIMAAGYNVYLALIAAGLSTLLAEHVFKYVVEHPAEFILKLRDILKGK